MATAMVARHPVVDRAPSFMGNPSMSVVRGNLVEVEVLDQWLHGRVRVGTGIGTARVAEVLSHTGLPPRVDVGGGHPGLCGGEVVGFEVSDHQSVVRADKQGVV